MPDIKMDLKIPVIKIDLHDDDEDAIKEESEEDDTNGNGDCDAPNINKDIEKKARGCHRPAAHVSDEKTQSLQKSKQETGDSCSKLKKLSKSSIRSIRLETLEGVKGIGENDKVDMETSDQISGRNMIKKRNSLPQLDITRLESNVDAIVSPLILRRFRQANKRMSINVLPQNGTTNLIEISAIARARSPKLLPKLESSWISSEDDKLNLRSKGGPLVDQLSPNLLRKTRQKYDISKSKRKNEDKLQQKARPRSQSLSILVETDVDDQEEIVDTYHKPSTHWRMARDHTIARSMKLPDVVQLCQNKGIASIKQAIQDLTIPGIHSRGENIQMKGYAKNSEQPKLARSKSEDFFELGGATDEILYQNISKGISLEERLRAIEIKHGIVHEHLDTLTMKNNGTEE